MDDGEENIPISTIMKQILLRSILAVGIPALLLLLLIGWTDWRISRKLPEVDALAAKYLEENYPGHDFQWEAYYEPKIQGYVVTVQSQSSRDTRFELEYCEGNFTRDNYEFMVPTCVTTRARVAEEYKAVVQDALEDFPAHNVEANFFGAGGGCRVGEAVSALDTVAWVLDQEYDVSQVGTKIGYVILWFDGTKEKYQTEKLDELAFQAAQALEEAGIGFYAIDIMLAETRYYGSPMFHFEKRVLACELN